MKLWTPPRPLSALARATAVLISLVTCTPVGAGAAGAAPASPPPADKRPVEDRYFDRTVRDDYQWMEDWSDAALKAWVARANAKRSIAELRAVLKESLKEEATGKGRSFSSGREAIRWLES